MPGARLANRTVFRVSGSDAEHFLQNLVTCDVETLATGGLTFGALLTPQGKILFEFFVGREAGGFLLDTATIFAADLARRLTFYKLRANVSIETTGLPVSAAWGDGVEANDPRLAGFAHRSFAEVDGTDDYEAHRIVSGLPELGRDFDPESVFPHEALMDQFARGGVDFRKGCYVGQEVVSRMQHRGTARSRFVQISGNDLPVVGTPVTAESRAIGTMGSSVTGQGLALIRLDRAAEAMAAGTDILAGNAVITPSLPPFVSFDWPNTGPAADDGPVGS